MQREGEVEGWVLVLAGKGLSGTLLLLLSHSYRDPGSSSQAQATLPTPDLGAGGSGNRSSGYRFAPVFAPCGT